MGVSWFLIIVLLLAGLLLGMYCLNIKVKQKSFSQIPNQLTFKQRNFDYLVIGPFCDITSFIPQNSTHLDFMAPKRSFKASKLISKRMFSYVRENGTIIFIKNKKDNGKIYFTDLPFFHQITQNELNIDKNNWKYRIPILFSPILSIQTLLKYKRNKLPKAGKSEQEIVTFFKERNIRCEFKSL